MKQGETTREAAALGAASPDQDDDFFAFESESEETLGGEAFADGEKLADEVAAAWAALGAAGDAARITFNEDGVEAAAVSDRELHGDTDFTRSNRLKKEALAWLDRGWFCDQELHDHIGADMSDNARFEILFHLQDAGITNVEELPENGVWPDAEASTVDAIWIEEFVELSQLAYGHEPKYMPGCGALDRHNPLQVLLDSVSRGRILSRYEELAFGQAICDSLEVAVEAVRDTQTIRDRWVLDGLEPKARWSLIRSLAVLDEDIRDARGRSVRHVAQDALSQAQTLRNKFAEANLKLVVHLASKSFANGLSIADLIQEGAIGLLTAIERWDHHLGYKLSTYATWWIRQSISRAAYDKGRTIRVPVHLAEKINRVLQVQRRTEVRGVNASTKTISQETGYDEATVGRLVRLIEDVDYLDGMENIIDQCGHAIEEPLAFAEKADLYAQVHDILAGLPPRLSAVLKLRFGIGNDGNELTLDEIGRDFGLTRERIRQIESSALRKLRHPSRCDSLADLLEDS